MSPTQMFIRPYDQYDRNYDILKGYQEDQAFYLSLVKNKPIDEAREIVQGITEKKRDPNKGKIKFLYKDKEGDRQRARTDFDKYVGNVEKRGLIMSPTMTSYVPPSKRKSLYAEMSEDNVILRSKAKDEKKAAQLKHDKILENFKEVQQTTYKIKNNSLSGAHGSAGTPLFLPSAHPTLTSTCRTMTTINNAHTERFITNNRHYYSPAVTINAITNVARRTDCDRVARVIEKYRLRYPTVKEVYEGIIYSTTLYWNHEEAEQRIFTFLSNLNEQQLAMVHMNGSLEAAYWLYPEFIDTMVTEIGKHCPDETPTDVKLGKLSEEEKALIGAVNLEDVRGKMLKEIIDNEPKLAARMQNKFLHLEKVLEHYGDFITTFLATDFLPNDFPSFTSSIRRCVPVSDTDSTVYTVQNWVQRKYPNDLFSADARRYSGAVSYLNNKLTGHWLAMMSKSIGAEEQHKENLVMKNEFSFPVIFMTGRAKHYIFEIDGCEGAYFDKSDYEMKGVSLRGSKIHQDVMDLRDFIIKTVVDNLKTGTYCDPVEFLRLVAELEHRMHDSLSKGEVEYFTNQQVNGPASYTNPDNCAYNFKTMWDDAFGDKYGMSDLPPYSAKQITLALKSKAKIAECIANMKDKTVAAKLVETLHAHNKEQLGSFLIPANIGKKSGIPEEFIPYLDVRLQIAKSMKSIYILLETMGLYTFTSDSTVLVMDNYSG